MGLGNGNVLAFFGRSVFDGKPGIQAEVYPSPFWLVFHRDLNRMKAALLLLFL